MLYRDFTERIISAFYEVHHEMGHGFLESVYERAMVIALEERGVEAARQTPIDVRFKGIVVGTFCADLLVEKRVIVELKAGRALDPVHEAQLLNYMRASRIEVGLLLHFGHKPKFHRRILTNDRKVLQHFRGLLRPSVVQNAPTRRIRD